MRQEQQSIGASAAVAVGLVVLVAAVYAPILSADFIDVDDPPYVTENHFVRGGLTWANVRWSLGAIHAQNWHPVTWVSHQADCHFFGVDPGWHHGINVLIHAVNALLAFQVFLALTGRITASALVAALFAVHPVNVESVAWVSERKTLLATLFGLATLWAYAGFVRRPGFARYLWVIVLFGLSLGSKPMLVTLPLVMLLLDGWPFGRVGFGESEARKTNKSLGTLLVEKMPLLAMAAASCLVTLYSQGYARSTSGALPFAWRLGNAARAYGAYLLALAWPVDLAFAYPHPRENLSTWAVLFGLVTLAGVSAGVWRSRRGYAAVGWLWYLGTLVPMIGLVQVGKQGMADRYLYWPALGIFLLVAFGACDLLAQRRKILGVASIAVIFILVLLSRRQVGFWRDTVTLAERALQVAPENAVAAYLSGVAHERTGQFEQARERLERAVRLDPLDAQARLALAAFQTRRGETAAALAELGQLEGRGVEASEVLLWKGVALAKAGQTRAARQAFERIRQLEPDNAEAAFNLGMIALAESDPVRAKALFGQATRINPLHSDAWLALAELEGGAGNWSQAAACYRRALELRPGAVRARIGSALSLVRAGRVEDGIQMLEASARDLPPSAEIRHALGLAYSETGRPRAAVEQWRKALALDPDGLAAANDLAWILATHPDESIRNGAEAERAALRAVEGTGRKDPSCLDTLAAALAEKGDFDQAALVARAALGLAEGMGLSDLAEALRQRIEKYQAKRPHRADPRPLH